MRSSFEAAPRLPRPPFKREPLGAPPPAPAPGKPEAPAPPSAAAADPAPVDDAVKALRAGASALQRAAAELQGAREEDRAWLRSAALELGVALAERLLERELSLRPDALRPMLERAVALLKDQGPLRIAISEADHRALGSGEAPWLAEVQQTSGAALEPDAGLARGEARVFAGSAHARVDVDSMLACLREELAELCLDREEPAEPNAAREEPA